MLEKIAGLLWGPWMIALVLGAGAWFTIGTRFISVRKLGAAFKAIVRGEQGAGEVSPFAALCTSLAATLGTGNIIGVATALAAGGPGALFWMVFASFLGMAIKYAEGFLAIRYRCRNRDGSFLGGPFLYLELGLGSPLLAKIFAIGCLCACLFSMGTTSQINGIAAAAVDFFGAEKAGIWAGAIVTLLVGLVLAGGIRRIATVASLAVPLMAALYMGLTLWLLIIHHRAIPSATLLMLRSAFAPQAALGGAAGITFRAAVRYGLGRGIFSNEAGMGSDPIAAATAQTKDAARQGLISMLGPFLDTTLMCALTGYAVLLTDAWQVEGLAGAEITLFALLQLPLPKGLVSLLYLVCLFFFGFCSIIGWSFYGEQSLRYLLPDRRWGIFWFRVIFLTILFCGSFLSAAAVWSLADLFCGLMMLPNLIGLFGLSKEVFRSADRNEGI